MPKNTQIPLFDDLPAPSQRLAESFSGKKPADKNQAAFQRLVKQLEDQRAELAAWQNYGVRYQQRLTRELLPVQQAYRENRRKMAFQLDAAARQPGLLRGKVQRSTLQRLIIDLTQSLLQEEPDAEIEAIHDTYSGLSFAENQAEDLALTQSVLESIFGVEIEDSDEARTADELYSKFSEQFAQQTRKRPEKRKTARQEAAAAKKEEAAKAVSQTVRAVYRKLASSLHPDRETDATERERKTALMQRVNQAYEAGDLLSLLNLQFEIEQIDADHVASLTGERLQHYNQVLREQVAELKAEIEAAIQPFRPLLRGRFLPSLTPDTVDRALSAEIADQKQSLAHLQADLEAINEPAQLKAMLKHYRPDAPDIDYMDLDDLDVIFGGFDKPAPRRRRKTR